MNVIPIALLCAITLMTPCIAAQTVNEAPSTLPPLPAGAYQRNFLDLYGDGSEAVAGAETRSNVIKLKTVVLDIDSIPPFDKYFSEEDVAIVIGIEEYKNLPPVDYATNDAKLVHQYVEQLGFSPRQIRFLLNGDATESAIKVAVERWAVNVTKPSSRVFFYYSGHGSPDPVKGDAYLVPFDGDPQYLADTAYSLQRLYSNLGKLPAKEIIVVVDACFSGIGPRSVLAKGTRGIGIRKKESRPENVAMMSAANDQQTATFFPEKQHGLFTYQFLKALHSGRKNVSEIFSFVEQKVADEARRQNGSQTPQLQLPDSTDPNRFRLVQ